MDTLRSVANESPELGEWWTKFEQIDPELATRAARVPVKRQPDEQVPECVLALSSQQGAYVWFRQRPPLLLHFVHELIHAALGVGEALARRFTDLLLRAVAGGGAEEYWTYRRLLDPAKTGMLGPVDLLMRDILPPLMRAADDGDARKCLLYRWLIELARGATLTEIEARLGRDLLEAYEGGGVHPNWVHPDPGEQERLKRAHEPCWFLIECLQGVEDNDPHWIHVVEMLFDEGYHREYLASTDTE